jgi:hypothetical protein
MKSSNGHIVLKVSKRSHLKQTTSTKESPEAVIVRLAKTGKLAAAGKRAMQSSLQKGLSVTILENGKIYRVYSNGDRKLIKSISPPKHKYITGKARIA